MSGHNLLPDQVVELTWDREEGTASAELLRIDKEGPNSFRSWQFESLDDEDLPDTIADIIREDGRTSGRYTQR